MQAESVFAKPDILELNLCSIRGMGAPLVRPANNQHSCGKMQLQKLLAQRQHISYPQIPLSSCLSRAHLRNQRQNRFSLAP
jgi:hypothetical protein